MTSTSPNKSTETSVKESGQALISLDGRERREGCFLRLRASTSPACLIEWRAEGELSDRRMFLSLRAGVDISDGINYRRC
jgi:hypothetical protein